MRHTTLVIPGFHGSGPEHWQSWFETQVPEARRVRRINWEEPIIGHWARAVRQEIDAAHGPVWLVAHSFGCLAAVVAAANRADRVAGALLVAPADPTRFNLLGLRRERDGPCGDDNLVRWMPESRHDLVRWMPVTRLGFPSIVVASANDPWVKLSTATYWADRWGSRLFNIGHEGHINAESGYGPWPTGLALYHSLVSSEEELPLGGLEEWKTRSRGRHSVLARLRQQTRENWGFFARLGF